MSDKVSYVSVTLGEMVGIHRDRLHISQGELAKRAGVSRNYISLIECGQGENVSFKVLQKICAVLGVEIHFVMKEANNE